MNKQVPLSELINDCFGTNKLDAILLCETWHKPDTNSLISIPGYNFHGIARENKQGAGVGILVNSNLQYIIRKDLQTSEPHLECFGLEVKAKKKNILLTTMYRPLNTNEKNSNSTLKKSWEK